MGGRNRGVRYLALRQVECLVDARIAPSVDDPYDNVLAQSVIGLCKTEVIRRRRPWMHVEPVARPWRGRHAKCTTGRVREGEAYAAFMLTTPSPGG